MKALLVVPSVIKVSEGIFGEVVVTAEVTLVSWLLLAVVGWTGERGLLVRKALSVVKVFEGVFGELMVMAKVTFVSWVLSAVG